MVSQGTWSSGHSETTLRNHEFEMEQFDWCDCENWKVVYEGVSWTMHPVRPFSQCPNWPNGCRYFRWDSDPLEHKVEKLVCRLRDEKEMAEANEGQYQYLYERAVEDSKKLQLQLTENVCRISKYHKLVVGLSVIGVALFVMLI